MSEGALYRQRPRTRFGTWPSHLPQKRKDGCRGLAERARGIQPKAPNRVLAPLWNVLNPAVNVETALSRLAQKVETVVVKMGAKGAIAIRDGQRFSTPAVPVTVIDPIGAGDSFDAGFLHQFLRGTDLTRCLAYGNLCGAFSTTDCGGTEAFRNAARMQEFFRRHDTGNQVQ